jgi:signal transduction histidine kinase/CheY-like chemotaxis protein
MSSSSESEAPDGAALRLSAEARLGQSRVPAHADKSVGGEQRLLHELQVHQIELEMQNEQLRAAQAEVEAGLARYTELYDLAPVGYYALDRQGVILRANLAGARLLQRERGPLVGQLFSSFLGGSERAAFDKFLGGNFAADPQPACELTLKTSEGGTRTLRLEASLAPDGQECRVVATDISARVAAEAARAVAEARLRAAQKMEAIGMLAQGIAHDFNNLLAAMGGYTELARWHAQGNPGVLAALDELSTISSHATTLVRQIHTFSRPDKSGREAVQLAPLVRESLRLLRGTVPTSITFQIELSAEDRMVLANPAEIHQIIWNLTTNATYAMRGQSGLLRVTLAEHIAADEPTGMVPGLRPGPYLLLSVTDTGRGMDQATVERVFEPFFTSKGHEGTGLGLTVVQTILHSLGGTITVRSQLGTGTTFDLYLPVLSEVRRASGAAISALPCGRGERILFVDDESCICRVIKEMLERLGYVVDTETNPPKALASVRAQPTAYSLVVTDLTMPGLSGIQLAEQLLALQPDLPIVLVSGNVSDLTASQAVEMGIREVLSKPFSMETLSRAIHRNLRATSS